jgi:hypothetical protein
MWPLPDADMDWQLRWDERPLTPDERCYLASVMSAYRELIQCTDRKRRVVVRHLAAALAAVPTEEKPNV